MSGHEEQQQQYGEQNDASATTRPSVSEDNCVQASMTDKDGTTWSATLRVSTPMDVEHSSKVVLSVGSLLGFVRRVLVSSYALSINVTITPMDIVVGGFAYIALRYVGAHYYPWLIDK